MAKAGKRDKPYGTWAQARDGMRDKNDALQQAHVRMQVEFMPNLRVGPRDRIESRARAVMQMRDACEAWLTGLDGAIGVLEKESG